MIMFNRVTTKEKKPINLSTFFFFCQLLRKLQRKSNKINFLMRCLKALRKVEIGAGCLVGKLSTITKNIWAHHSKTIRFVASFRISNAKLEFKRRVIKLHELRGVVFYYKRVFYEK